MSKSYRAVSKKFAPWGDKPTAEALLRQRKKEEIEWRKASLEDIEEWENDSE